MRIIAVLAATGAGAAVGWLCGLVPVWPVLRFAAAALLGSVVSSIVVVFTLLTLSRSGSGGLGAVSVGLSEAIVLEVPALVLAAAIAYFALRRLGWRAASLAAYGSVIVGGLAALITAV